MEEKELNSDCAVLLGAGRSKRFGANKLLHPLDNGVPLAVTSARPLVQAIGRVLAVVRPGEYRLERLLLDESVQVVMCADADQGMGRSLAAGISAARDARGWVIALADMPYIQADTIFRVAECLRQGASLVAPVYRGRRGHPVGFGRQYRTELIHLDTEWGAREILRRDVEQLTTFDVDDPGILYDIDTRADMIAPPALGEL